jgi:hypothetical protein
VDLKKEQGDIIRQLHEADSKDYATKKDLVTKLIEVSRLMVKSELIHGVILNDLASYINGRLDEYGIKFPRNQDFYNLFSEKEKREYGTNSISMSRRNHKHIFESVDQYTKKCECGIIQFYGINYERKEDEIEDQFEAKDNFSGISEPMLRIDQKSKPQIDPYKNPLTEYFQRIHYNALDLAELADDLVKKYYSNKDIAKIMENAINFKLDDLIDEQKSLEAKIIHMNKQADFRQKIGEFEKIKAIILEKTTYNVAKVAKMLAITPKHMTNNIIRNLDEFKRHMKWFRSILLKCNHCNKMVNFDMFDWYNEQLVRKNLDLELRQPIKT